MSTDRRLAWRCRRGMKELDLFFEPFVRDALPALDARLRGALDRLLDLPDQEILALLCGTGPAGGEPGSELLEIIRGARAPARDGTRCDR